MLTIVIPTLNRGSVLVETLRQLMALEPPASEILVLDQTPQHKQDVQDALSAWRREGKIRWIQLSSPSATRAMNQGLVAANCENILFLDDDIIPEPSLITAHLAALNRDGVGLVAGRVIQPWEEDRILSQTGFHFAQDRSAWISEFMGGNFSIRRALALAVGGFDENFVRVAYHFEAEFAYRLQQRHHRIYFEPAACVHHLKVPSGGTRTFGDHLRSFWPSHSVGAYYYHLRTWSGWPSLAALLSRFPRAIVNRHHLRRPWWIPATTVAELSGMIWALCLAVRGPRYASTKQTVEHE
jgi:GT2 family glycosyltransferase